MLTLKDLERLEQQRLVGQEKDFLDAIPVLVFLGVGLLGIIVGINLGVSDGTHIAIAGTAAGGAVIHYLSRLVINGIKGRK